MTLGELLHGADSLSGLAMSETVSGRSSLAQIVTHVMYDSRRVSPGAVFVGLKGQRTDGTLFAKDAVHHGAILVVSESDPGEDVRLPWLIVDDARQALAALAASLYGRPSLELRVVGITGTNGKTTTAYLLSAIFERAGVQCGRLGTVSHQVGSEQRAASLTTPEAPDVQRLFRDLVDAGSTACAMEVSSHALALKRVEYTRFAAAVFTNLTRDHLNFHDDMGSYFNAKQHLFDMLPDGAPAVVNVDDPRGSSLVEVVARPVTYAIDREAEILPGPIDSSLVGLRFDVRTPRGSLHVHSRLVGRANVYNILAASAAAAALELPFAAIEQGVADLETVPGRFQIVSDRSDDVIVVVDYAHTDDALRALLETARQLVTGRVITVFGCGGDRDRTKRPLMGAVAARLSELVVLTSDNPRSEDPAAIIDEIVHGMTPGVDRAQAGAGQGTAAIYGTPYLTIVDRDTAIERAIRDARSGDVVLIAGKGHEMYQAIAGRTRPFDDAAVARAALATRRTHSHVS